LVFELGGIGDFTNDDSITDIDEEITGQDSGAVARLVDWDPLTRTLRYIQTRDTLWEEFQVGEEVDGEFGEAWTIESLTNPEIKLYSGELMYLDNREAIVREIGQEEVIRLVLYFKRVKTDDNNFNLSVLMISLKMESFTEYYSDPD
jgi:hypothetical protein